MTRQSPSQIIRLTSHNTQRLADLDKLYRAFAVAEGHTVPPEHFTEFVAARLDDDVMLVVLALVGDDPVGYALVFDVVDHPFIPDWQRTGYITQMFVRADRQRQGIGQQMVDYTLAWLAQRAVPQVMLNVHAHNDSAADFWCKVGFTPYLSRMRRELA